MSAKVILVGYEKGGVGKTATVINLAVALSIEHYSGETDRILLVDADKQGTLYRWNQKREDVDGVNAFPCSYLLDNINQGVNIQRDKYDYIIIDAAGRDSREMRSGMLCCDLMVMPIETACESTDLLENMAELYTKAQDFSKDLQAVVFLNKVATTGSVEERQYAKSLLSEFPEFKLLKTMMYVRTAHKNMSRIGMGAMESKDSRAKGEVSCLLREVLSYVK